MQLVLLRVLVAFTFLFLLPDWYIYKYYIKNTNNRIFSFLLWTPGILMLAGMFGFALFKDSLYGYFGVYLIVAMCICVPKLLFMLFSLLVKGIGRLTRRSLPHAALSSVPALFVLGYIIFGATAGKEKFTVKEVTFSHPDLPEAFDGYRILQLSDIHSGSWRGDTVALNKAMDICLSQKADIALFTGDMVNSSSVELSGLVDVFSRLKATDGVYSVLGNHDYGLYSSWNTEADRLADVDSLISMQNAMGWHMLNNSHVVIRRGNDSIAVIGVENSGKPPFPDYARLDDAVSGTEGMFQVLMSHDPTHWRREVLPQGDVELMLAGHTHDMQISFFGFSASSLVYPEHNGLYLEGSRGLYVNIGMGFVLFPMRIGAWPEITVITLKKG